MNRPLASPASSGLSQTQIRTILIGVVLAMLLGALDQTIVATALPTIGRELGDVRNLSWVVTAYLLTATAVTPLYGKLSDIHGRRSMLLLAIAVFLGGSVACALSRDVYVLVAARALQGLGGGGLLSLGMTIIGDVIAPRERGRYQAYFAAVFVTSSIAGPVLGGFFAQHLHWSFIFWINLPLGVVAYLMTNRVLRLLPRHDRPHRIDAIGALVMVIATVTLLTMLSWGGTTYSWTSWQIAMLAAVSALSWGLFALRLRLAPEPFIPPNVLANAVVRNGIASTALVVGTMVGLTVYVPLYFEAVLGLTASQSGLALIALMGGTVTGATTAGRIMARFEHYKRAGVAGLALGVAAMAVMAEWPVSFSVVGVEVLLAITGVGIGTTFPITTTSVQNAVTPHELGTTTGVLNFFRSLGGAILVASFGAILIGSAAGSDRGSIRELITKGGRTGFDFTPVFRGVFAAAALTIALALIALIAMKEQPLRSHTAPERGTAG